MEQNTVKVKNVEKSAQCYESIPVTHTQEYIDNITTDLRDVIEKSVTPDSEIHILNDGSRPDVYIDMYGTLVTELSGGLNSIRGGDWSKYFHDLSEIIKVLYTEYGIDAWLIGMKNDVLDDVFYVKLGIRYEEWNRT